MNNLDKIIENEKRNLKRARNITIAIALITFVIFVMTGIVVVPMGGIALICVIYLSWPSVKRKLFSKKAKD